LTGAKGVLALRALITGGHAVATIKVRRPGKQAMARSRVRGALSRSFLAECEHSPGLLLQHPRFGAI
jgi:hypothetical protein